MSLEAAAPAVPSTPSAALPAGRLARWIAIGFGAAIVAGILAWQGLTASGNPDPTMAAASSRSVAVLDIGVLVFREGLETILVLSAITASMVGANRAYRQPVAAGAGAGFLATIVTWFVAIGIVSDLADNFPALSVQAGTGLLAVVVLLVVMNWFFHKVYWGGWIALHNRRKRDLIKESAGAGAGGKILWGMGLLGFSSLYREGFEVVLFLQSYRLRLGGAAVYEGVALGLLFTAIVAALTFVAHRKLPYRRMLVLTGALLGVVLLVMVGEEAQEMQQAHWIPTTTIVSLDRVVPAWAGVWFSVFPTVETLAAQGLAALLVLGSFFLARRPAVQQPCHADCAGDPACALPSSASNPACARLCETAAIRRLENPERN